MGKPFGWDARQARKAKNLQKRKREIDTGAGAAEASASTFAHHHLPSCSCKFRCPECGAGFPKWAGKGAVSCNNHLRETGHAAGKKAADCRAASCRGTGEGAGSGDGRSDGLAIPSSSTRELQIKGGVYRCPDCSEMFTLWKECLEHCSTQMHGGWPKAKGLRKRCRPADQQVQCGAVSWRCTVLLHACVPCLSRVELQAFVSDPRTRAHARARAHTRTENAHAHAHARDTKAKLEKDAKHQELQEIQTKKRQRKAAAAAPPPPPAPISSGIGHKLLQMMGWSSGEGLGKEGQGRVEPVAATLSGKLS